MAIKSGLSVRGPLRYSNEGASFGSGADGHPFHGIEQEYLDNLPVVVGDTEFVRQYGWAFAAIGYPGPLAGAAAQGGLQTLGTGFVTAIYSGAGPLPFLRLSTGNTDNQLASIRSALTPFKYTKGKRAWLSILMQAPAVSTGELVFGFVAEAYAASVAANSFAVASLPVDGIFFIKDDAASQFTAHVRKASASTSLANVDGSTWANATNREYTIVADEFGNVHFFVDGVRKFSVASTDANLPSVNLAFLIGRQTSGGVFTLLDIAQVLCAEEL